MLNSNRSGSTFAHAASQPQAICVVDPQAADYGGWEASAHANGVRLHIVASADEALRLARTTAVDLWVVNVELPGLSGCELCSMLRSRCRSPIYLVANQYTPAAEQAAWQARPTLFGCKGDHHQWLDHWLRATRSRAPHRSPRSAPRYVAFVR